ncbi:DUF6348 family protein [Undibacterium sp. Ren11W]|uniref:DUF6348 family protein n=1 Tax=Undibacterium sp. Ren11W TaxID=3413045 RepID=UPI003BF185F2
MSLINIFSSFKNRFSSTAKLPALAHPEVASVATQRQADPTLMQALADLLLIEGIEFAWSDAGLRLASGLLLQVEPIESITLADGRVRTCTKMHVAHPEYFPDGIYEYQHAIGASEALAVAEGFRAWTQMDLVVLTDATRETPLDCTVIEMSVAPGAQPDGMQYYRQVLLGPVAHLATLPAPEPKEAHPFCPCCLFTESTAALHDLLQSQKFLGLRMFVSRDSQGRLAVDCRVNGEDFDGVQDSLTAYARNWPERGLEFRKQYVLMRSRSRSAGKDDQRPDSN